MVVNFQAPEVIGGATHRRNAAYQWEVEWPS